MIDCTCGVSVFSTFDLNDIGSFDGNTWEDRSIPGVTDNLYDVAFRNQNEGTVVAANGVVRYTTNGATIWLQDTHFSGLTKDDIIALAIQDENTATAIVRGTNSGGMATTTLITVSSEPINSNDDGNILPSEYSLGQNYPNPFTPSTTIQFSVSEQSFVTLEVFNTLGEKITTLVSKELNAGNHKYDWNAKNNPGGTYFYRLHTDNFSKVNKMVLMK